MLTTETHLKENMTSYSNTDIKLDVGLTLDTISEYVQRIRDHYQTNIIDLENVCDFSTVSTCTENYKDYEICCFQMQSRLDYILTISLPQIVELHQRLDRMNQEIPKALTDHYQSK